MAAGLGYKDFVTGEVLTAGDVNGYLMQGVLVFASAAARNAAITAPQEGQFAYTKDTNGLWYYDGAAWVASGATGDIEGVTAGIGISGGGTSGTVTVTNSMATAIDAKGDLVAGTGADAFSRLAVGANNTVLQADSTTATGLKYSTPAVVVGNIVTAKGDVIAATASGTVTNLAVGANATVLTADSTTATGLKWAAPSASKSYSLLGTATLASAGTITISGLSGYDNLMITIDSAKGPASAIMTVRFNSSTGPYPQFGQATVGGSSYSTYVFQSNTQPSSSSISFGDMSANASSNVCGIIQVLGANGSGLKAWTSVAGTESNGAATTRNYFGGGMFEPTAVISSVSIICNAGGNNFVSGTMKVYGAA